MTRYLPRRRSLAYHPPTMPYQPSPTRYDKMQYRRCGRSGLLLPAISLGAWETFGGYRGTDVARECIFLRL